MAAKDQDRGITNDQAGILMDLFFKRLKKVLEEKPTDVWVSREEAAKMLRMSLTTIDKVRKAGKLRSFRKPGSRGVLMLREDIDKYPVEIPLHEIE